MTTTENHWLTAERLRLYPIGIAITTVAVLLIWGGISFRSTDFAAFYTASGMVLAGHGSQVWDVTVFADAQRVQFDLCGECGYGWFYPPTFLLVVAPLALVPYPLAFVGFVGATAAMALVPLRRAIARPGGAWAVAAFPGAFLCALMGQNGFLTAGLAGGALIVLRRRPGLAGVLIGLLAIKPHLAALFAVGLVAVRGWRTLAAAAGTALAFLGVSLLVFGPDALGAWLSSLGMAQSLTATGILPLTKMPSTFAALRLLGAPATWAWAGHAVVAMAAIAMVWTVWRRSSRLPLRGAVLMTATFLVVPYAFDYDLVWLAFPIAWLAIDGLESGAARGDIEILVAAWLLPMAGTILASATHVQVAPLVLLAVCWIAFRRSSDPTRLAAAPG